MGLATAVVTNSGLGTVLGTCSVAVGYVVGEGVTECGVNVGLSIGLATAVVTSGGLSAVFKTGSVAVGNVIGVDVRKGSAFCYNSVGFLAAGALCGLSSVNLAYCVVIVNVCAFKEFVTKRGTLVGQGVGFLATGALCSLSTVKKTGCIVVGNVSVFKELVSKCGDYEVIDNLAFSVKVEGTSCTGVVAYNTVVKTVGSNAVVPILAKELVTEFSVNHVLAAELSVASATVNNLVVVTVENTGRIYGVFNHSLVRCVTELLNYVCLVGLTVVTGVNGVAVLGTGGSYGSAGCINVFCGGGDGRGRENYIVLVESYNCVGVVDRLFAVSCDLMTGKDIVVCDGVIC